jgi:hypothetical protein
VIRAHSHIHTRLHASRIRGRHPHIRTSAHLFRFVSVIQTPFIRKSISVLLLLVFLISAAPKTYFHDVVADHKDQPVSCLHKNHKSPCVHQSHINCHFDQLVVTSFFQFQPLNFPQIFTRTGNSDHSFYSERPVAGRIASPDGRGPPMG